MFCVEEISLGIGTRHPIKSDFVPKRTTEETKNGIVGKNLETKVLRFAALLSSCKIFVFKTNSILLLFY
jgi:hypothetical protein